MLVTLRDQGAEGFLTLIFAQFSILLSCGMVFVTTTASRSLSSILRRAGPEKIPCVSIA